MRASDMPAIPFDDSVPIPPRYWWLKRITIASFVLILALVGLRLWWGWFATRLLQAEINRIIAAGEPIYPEDFDSKEDIPADQNAAKLLEEAVNSVDLFNERSATFQAIDKDDEPIARHLDGVKNLLEANAKTLQLARRASSLPQTDWGLRIRTPAYQTFSATVSFNDYRLLARILHLSAEYQAIIGKHDEAARTCLDNLYLGEAVTSQPTTISQLVGWAIQGLTLEQIEQMVMPDSGVSDSAKYSLTYREIVHELIRRLADDQSMRGGLEHAFTGERVFLIDALKEFEQGAKGMTASFGWHPFMQAGISDVVWRFGLAPIVRLDVLRYLELTRKRIRAVRSSRWRDALVSDAEVTDNSLAAAIQKPISTELTQSLNHSVEIFLRYLAWRRLTATGLAIRVFRADRGRLPESLEELVPEYLSQLPLDPQSIQPKSFGYLPHADPPIVYGVGENGMDENGKYAVTDGYARFREGDMPFFINGDRPRPVYESESNGSESTEAMEDDGGVEDEDGDHKDKEAQEEEPEQR